MLQPRQLEEVSVRHTVEIAELADFFVKAGLTLHTPETFGAVAARVREDRAFSRDLTSHVWVFIHAAGGHVSYSDLLGMLAIAAAGPRFAASANEADAHDLLRFLMEAQGAFDTPTASRTKALAPALAPLPTAKSSPSAIQSTVADIRQPEPEDDSPLSFEIPQNEDENRPIVWFAFAACALLLLCGSLWFLHSSSTGHGTPIAATTEPAPLATSRAVDAARDAVSPTQRPQHMNRSQIQVARRAPAPVSSPTHPTPRVTSQPAPVPSNGPSNAAAYTPPTAPSNRMSKPSPASTSTTMAKASPTRAPIPMRLLRRPGTVPPVVPVSSFDASEARTSSLPTDGSVRQATVRATSLGTMAGNVTYSPVPAYPKAASAQHVQGEVKLEAEVDPNGSVVSTRIISGPPLLQEAAADAVQHWRYRPFLYNDKPIGMNATVVMDFQLP